MTTRRSARHSRPKRLTKRMLQFIAAWEGNPTEAVRSLGWKNPKQTAYEMMHNPLVAAEIEKKKSRILEESAKQFVMKLKKTDITGGIVRAIQKLEKMADVFTERKKINVQELTAVAKTVDSLTDSYDKLAEISGFKVTLSRNMDREFLNRSEEEMEYFACHGYWPNMDAGQPGTSRSESRSQEPTKPQ